MIGEKAQLGLFSGFPLILKIVIIILIAVLVVPGAMVLSPIIKYVIMAILVFFIYENVSKALGKGVLTIIITGVLAYFIIYKYLYLSASMMMFYIFLMFGVTSVFVWGTSTLSRKH